MRAAAIAHASQRIAQALELKQLVHEMRLLRATILHLLLREESAEQASEGGGGMAGRVVELARLNEGLDFAISDAIEHFVNERERLIGEASEREAALARESNERKSEFLAVLSHELRNPLAPIHNALYILECTEPGSEQSTHARDVIRRQVVHLTRLVDDLLDTTRISRGKIALSRERCDLREVVRSTCDDHRTTFERRRLALRLDVPAAPVWIDGDPIRIAQVVSNLLQNAAKFTRPPGGVSVAVRSSERRAALHVSDEGAGMEPSMLERIFEPFVQGPQGIAPEDGGLGLGLALVKALVQLHGGSVAARSGGAGRGSEFIVELPVAAAPAPPKRQQERRSLAGPSRLVLIIEDNIDAADTLAQVLELRGHRARVAYDGMSGMALARELKPDAILCDVGLPDVDGYEVAHTLRSNGDLPSTRLIALTGYAQQADRARAKGAGFDAHLPKPLPLEELTALLSRDA
ncbi:MAG TPA: ATP-binding protein [Anaeromyxobacteraceae bacterium]|nr:ATP-binding protein [Anaeromyxobacteraceae bacterium]